MLTFRRARGAALAVLLGWCAAAHAEEHAIGPERQAEVLVLLAPYALGAEVADGFVVWGVALERTQIALTLRHPDGTQAQLRLAHPDDAKAAKWRSASFALEADGAIPERAPPALARLVEAIQRNDHGGFWSTSGPAVPRDDPGVRSPQPPPPEVSHASRPADWGPLDGVAFFLVLVTVALVLSVRHLKDSPRWMAVVLGGAVVAGALWRLWLAPPTFLGAWPWRRLYPNVGAVAEGSWLPWLAERLGATLYLTDVSLWTNYAYAVVMPLVLFAHGTSLLRSARAGLWAAVAVAFLPQHIRFSRCEDGFIPSLVLTSLALALIHGWLREPSRWVRWLCLGVLPFILYPGLLLRPLNLLFVAVYVGAMLLLHEDEVPRSRRVMGLGVVLVVGAAAAVTFVRMQAERVAAVVEIGWLPRVLYVALNPRMLVLDDPTRTPPVLIVLAVAGGVWAWRAGQRRLVGFLSAWLLLFLVAHGVVSQDTMQPRYHLHLVVPFLLLGSLAVVHAKPAWWSSGKRRAALAVGGLSLLLAPLLHAGFITDVDYAELQEYRFVREARPLVPVGCTVVEYVGGTPGDNLGPRFHRLGERIGAHGASDFDVIALTDEDLPGRLDGLAAHPPACLFVYDGISCAVAAGGGKRPCTEVRRRLGARTVREALVWPRLYDRSTDPQFRLPAQAPLTLRLSRAER